MSDKNNLNIISFFSRLGVKIKLTFVIITLSLFVFLIGGILLTQQQKRNTLSNTFEKLELINNLKKNEIESYFTQLKDKIVILSDNELIVDAAKELKPVFRLLDTETNSIDDDNFEDNLKAFYNGEYISELNRDIENEYSVDDLYPYEEKTILLQYQFIAANPNSFLEKKLLDKPLNSSDYGELHFKFHPKIRELALKYDLEDIYLIDSETGHIFYSLNKNPDFATSLITGPYKNTALAINFNETNKIDLKNHFEISDFEFYIPSGLTTSMFISSPVFVNGKKIAVLAFRINTSKIDQLITNGLSWEQIGLEKTGDINIIGNDNKLRNNNRFNTDTPDGYIKTLKRDKIKEKTIERIKLHHSTALLLETDQYNKSYKPGLENINEVKKYRHNKIYSVTQKLNITGVTWNILTSINKDEALKGQRKTVFTLFIISLFLIIIALFAGLFYSRSLVERINTIKNAIITLSKGENFNKITDHHKDEIGETVIALNRLNYRINEASDFALNIGKGKFDIDFSPISNKDKLGVSLNEMKTSLELSKKDEEQRILEERKQNWTTEGIAIFAELLRKNNDNIDKLSLSLVGKLVEFLNASLAGIFLLNNDNTDRPVLELSSSYAFDRHKFLQKTIEIGEGLVGTCAQELKTIYLKDIPDDYIHISSGFGETKPKTILIVPMIVENNIMGVIEIGSMNMFEDYQIEFIEKIGENIGSTLNAVKINAKTSKLLEESRVRSEEMSAQEEEMRQNLEELQATQDEMKRIKEVDEEKNNEMLESIEKNRQLLVNVLNEIPGKIFVKDAKGVILICNQEVANVYNKKTEEIIGTSDFDNHPREDAEEYFKKEQEIIKNGAEKYIQKENISGKLKYLETTKMPFYIPHLDETGILGLQTDITESRKSALDYESILEILKKLGEKTPSFFFKSDKEGNNLYLEGKATEIVNKEKHKSLFELFENLKELLQEDKTLHEFSYSVSDKNIDWNYDILLINNSDSYIGFGIEEDVSKYNTSLKLAISSLFKTKDNFKNLKK